MTTRLTVATANTPGRLAPHRRMFRWCEANGADIILAQEHRDKDDWRTSKKRWGRYRPDSARSNTIYWRRATIKRTKKRGTIRLSSPGFRSYRDLLWAHFRVRKGNKPARVASVHLPAFYRRSSKNRIEYDKQAPMVAAWAAGGPNRIIGGDFNGTKGNVRMRPIDKVARLSRSVRSGPQGQRIDYVGAPRDGRWRVVETRRGPKLDSDHNIVLVTLEWR